MADISITFGQNIVDAIDRLAIILNERLSKMELQTQALVDAVNRAAAVLATETREVADTIAGLQVDNTEAQAVLDEQVSRLTTLADNIEAIVPTPEPLPEP